MIVSQLLFMFLLIAINLMYQVLTAIGNFCICSIAIGMVIEIIVMYPIQHRAYRNGIDNLLVLLIGGIPIAMPTVLSVTMAIGSHRLSQQGAITKRMTAIEEMAGMDVLCSDKTGTLTLNKLTVDKNLVEVSAQTKMGIKTLLGVRYGEQMKDPSHQNQKLYAQVKGRKKQEYG